MQDIILYVAIILVGYFITKKGLIPKFIDNKVGMLQSFSLFFLLGMMGYKIGADESYFLNSIFLELTLLLSLYVQS